MFLQQQPEYHPDEGTSEYHTWRPSDANIRIAASVAEVTATRRYTLVAQSLHNRYTLVTHSLHNRYTIVTRLLHNRYTVITTQ